MVKACTGTRPSVVQTVLNRQVILNSRDENSEQPEIKSRTAHC
jgi:hypothetical protein